MVLHALILSLAVFLVTGVQKATAPAVPTNTQRAPGPPPALVSSTSVGEFLHFTASLFLVYYSAL